MTWNGNSGGDQDRCTPSPKLKVSLQTAIDAISEVMLVIDRDFRIVLANRAARKLAGDKDPVSTGMTCHELSHHRTEPCEGADNPCPVSEVIATGKPVAVIHTHFNAIGDERFVRINASPIMDRSGRVTHVVEACRDITERKKAERTLKALNESLEDRVAKRTAKLEQNTAQLRALATELTRAEQRERKRLAEYLHDHLQQLLVGVKMGIESLQNQQDMEGASHKALTQIEEAVNQALEASRSLTFELSPPALYQGELVPILRWLASWMQEKHGLQIEVDADAGDERINEAERVLLFQAVRELLLNVVKHAGVNRAKVQVLNHEDDRLWIFVTDDGKGFDPSILEKEEDFRGGMGLLNIAERLEFLGGQLKVDSAVGRGTCMTLWIPITSVKKAKGEQEAT